LGQELGGASLRAFVEESDGVPHVVKPIFTQSKGREA
jgi:hypothetical protein